MNELCFGAFKKMDYEHTTSKRVSVIDDELQYHLGKKFSRGYSMGLSTPNQHDRVLSSDRPTDFK